MWDGEVKQGQTVVRLFRQRPQPDTAIWPPTPEVLISLEL